MLQAVFGEWWDYRQRLRVGGLEGPVASTSRILGIPDETQNPEWCKLWTKEARNIIILNPKVFIYIYIYIYRDSHPFNFLEVLPFPIGSSMWCWCDRWKKRVCVWWCGFETFRSWLVLCSINIYQKYQEAQGTKPNQLLNMFWHVIHVLCFTVWTVHGAHVPCFQT